MTIRTAMFAAVLTGGFAAAPAAPQPVVFAAATPGVCLYGRAAALGGSQAGRAGTQRLQQLRAGIAAELNAQRQPLIQEQASLQRAQGTIPAAQYQSRVASLQQRADALARLEQVREAQLQQTRVNAETQIGQVADQAAGQLVNARRCSVLIERGSAYGWNPAMDITPDVVREIDRRLPSVTINLVPAGR